MPAQLVVRIVEDVAPVAARVKPTRQRQPRVADMDLRLGAEMGSFLAHLGAK
jgi:hypothetical protein